MPRYDGFEYATGYYGQRAVLGYSVAPFTATVIDYGKVRLTWASLSSTFNAVRLVRNQIAFPETQEDGVVLWEETGLDGTFSRAEFVDGEDNFLDSTALNNSPLVEGRFAYYRMWLRKDNHVWIPVGDVFTLIPKQHLTSSFPGAPASTTHDRLMEMLPRVFTSATQSSTDVVDPTSTLYSFLKGFSLTLDELITYADLLKPDFSGLTMHPNMVSSYLFQLGLPNEYSLGLKALKRLVNESAFLKQNKATMLGIQTLAEILTGYAPVVSPSANLMLTMQDSTFYKGVGNWLPVGNCSVSSVTETPSATGVERAIDLAYTGKVVVGTAQAKLVNGTTAPKTKGIPVSPNSYYNVSFYAKSAASSASVTVIARWYNYLGELVSSNGSSPFSLSSSWTRFNFDDLPSPADAAYMGIELQFNTTGTYYLDMVQVAVALAPETPAYEEARGVSVLLLPKKTNLISNPSFDVLNGLWTIVDASHTLVDSPFQDSAGASQMLESVTSTDDVTSYSTVVSTVPSLGQYYSFSIYGKTLSGTETLNLNLSISDGVDTYTATQSVTFTDVWSRPYVRLFVPAGLGPTAEFTCSLNGITTGNTLDIDSAQLELGYFPTDYFDGEFPTEMGALWAGTTNESVSYLYPNKLAVVPRLIANLKDFLAIETPYYVSTYAGLEYSAIS